MLRTSTRVRVLAPAELPELLELVARDCVSNALAESRLRRHGLDRGRLGGPVWGWPARGPLRAACLASGNVLPIEATEDSLPAFVDALRERGAPAGSIVGPADAVMGMWSRLQPHWGPARDVRPRQPLLVLDGPPLVEPDPLVRAVLPAELPRLLPAAVAMYGEEVGVSPLGADGGASFRATVADLVAHGQSFARLDDGEVVFKADVGIVTQRVCQVQGVWVTPHRRGEGLSEPAMAAVAVAARERFAPLVSLYVNDHNRAARAAYERVGFREVGTFASVLF